MTLSTPLDEERETKLLPCPFCGGDSPMLGKLLRDGCQPDEIEAYAHTVRCHACAAEGGWAKSESGARRWWNRRASRSSGEPAPADESTQPDEIAASRVIAAARMTGVDAEDIRRVIGMIVYAMQEATSGGIPRSLSETVCVVCEGEGCHTCDGLGSTALPSSERPDEGVVRCVKCARWHSGVNNADVKTNLCEDCLPSSERAVSEEEREAVWQLRGLIAAFVDPRLASIELHRPDAARLRRLLDYFAALPPASTLSEEDARFAELEVERDSALEEAARICDARASSLHDDRDHFAANEAGKCAFAIRRRIGSARLLPIGSEQ